MRAMAIAVLLALVACDEADLGAGNSAGHAGEPYVQLRPGVPPPSSADHRMLDRLVLQETASGALLRRIAARDLTAPLRAEVERLERRQAETSADLQGAQRVILGREHEPEGPALRRPSDDVPEPVPGVASENMISSTIVAHYRADVDEIDRELPTSPSPMYVPLPCEFARGDRRKSERWSASQGLP